MKKKNGFTLIELLAVIIILGILMIIAIPSVTRYISDSRKNAYVDTAKEIIGGARNMVNEGKLEMYATDTTYYIPTSCVKTENALKSPYGEFTKAYVGVIYDGKGYKYYWISVDDAGQGVSKLTLADKLDVDDIESDLTSKDITDVIETTGIGNRSSIKILNPENGTWNDVIGGASNYINEDGSEITAAQILSNNPSLVEGLGILWYSGRYPNNYVLFNNGETWRIIGVYGNRLKIVRSNDVTRIKYNSGYDNSWNISNIKNYLENTYYPSIANNSREMIDDAVWLVGEVVTTSVAEAAYNEAATVTWNGKIGLLSSYEYRYAAGGDCATVSYFYNTSCASSNWIQTTYGLWSMNGYKDTWSYNHGSGIIFHQSGYVTGSDINSTYYAVRPTVYLNSSVKITGGTGTVDDPYTLDM